MEILGIGPSELFFIIIIALILLGPKDMIAAGRTIGKTLRKIVTSPTWKAVRNTGQELQHLPTRLMREAGLDEDLEEIEKEMRDLSHVSIDPRRDVRSFDERQLREETTPPAAEPEDRAGSLPEAGPEDPRD